MAVLCNLYWFIAKGRTNMPKYSKSTFYKFRNRKKHFLNVESQVTNLFMTFYPEQVIDPKLRAQLFPHSNQDKDAGKQVSNPEYWNTPYGREIVEKCKKQLANTVIVIKDEWTVALICHDKDMTVDENDKMKPKHKKTHFHCVAWRNDGKRFRVRQFLNALNLHFDGVLDNNIMDSCFSFTRSVKNSLQYLLHMTEKSEEDGKAPYNRSELITNILDEELDKIYHAEVKDVLKNDDWDELAKKAYSCGFNFHDFKKFTNRFFNVRQQSQAPYKVVKQYYENGLLDGIAKAQGFPRLNIILRGSKNTGKSYSTQKVLNEMGYRIYKPISGSGKYDGLSADDNAMLFDDKNASQLLQICSDEPTLLHRRNVGYSPWTGNTTVMLTNKSFTQYIKSSARDDIHTENGKVIDDDKDTYDAMASRFYFCEVVWPDFQPAQPGVDHSRDAYIKVVKRYDRGSEKNKQIHNEMFNQLISRIENEIKNYYQIKYNEYWQKEYIEIKTKELVEQDRQKKQQKVVSTDKNGVQYYFDNRIENIDNQNDTETTENVDKSTTSTINRVKTQSVLDLEKHPIFENKNDDSAVGHDANALTSDELDELADSFGIIK